MSEASRPLGKRIHHTLEYLLCLFVGGGLRVLPRRFRHQLGRLAGGTLFHMDKKHQAVTLDNLSLAFGASKTDEEKYAIARGAYRHFGAMMFELMSIGAPSWPRLQKMVEFEGADNYERARESGRGVLLVAAHFGNWEIHAMAHGYRFGPMSVVARLQENPYFNRMLERIRTLNGNSVLYKERALPRMLRKLKDGETIAVLIDQNVAREEGVFVDFFGRPAATTPVASWLAFKTGAALVPVFTLPLADGRYRLIYEKPVDRRLYRGPDRRDVMQHLTQSCASVLEAYVRRNPEFWLWMHRRWKTQPAAERPEPAALRAGEAS